MSFRAKRLRDFLIISCCRSGFSASPNGYPRSNGTNSARGGLIIFVISSKSDIETVGMPTRSISAAIKPTAWTQKGQTGARKTASTPSSLSKFAALGAVSLISLLGEIIEPMNEK